MNELGEALKRLKARRGRAEAALKPAPRRTSPPPPASPYRRSPDRRDQGHSLSAAKTLVGRSDPTMCCTITNFHYSAPTHPSFNNLPSRPPPPPPPSSLTLFPLRLFNFSHQPFSCSGRV